MFLAVFSTKGNDEVSPDATLMQQLLRRDVSAFEELYERHSRIVYSLVLRILRQGTTAEEVVQDVFLQLWRKQTGEFPQIATAAPEYEKALDEKRRAERVRSLMSSLPAAQKKAIELAYFEGLSHSEIAASLHEPLGTVKSWIRNGLLRLKEGLQATS